MRIGRRELDHTELRGDADVLSRPTNGPNTLAASGFQAGANQPLSFQHGKLFPFDSGC